MKKLRPSNIPQVTLGLLGLFVLLAYIYTAQAEIPVMGYPVHANPHILREGRGIIGDVKDVLRINASRAVETPDDALYPALAGTCSQGLTFVGEWELECSATAEKVVINVSHPSLDEPLTGEWQRLP